MGFHTRFVPSLTRVLGTRLGPSESRALVNNRSLRGLVHELRLEIYKKPKVIIAKGVWASYVIGDHVINITRVSETGKKYLEEAQTVTNEEADHLREEDKEKFKVWFPTNTTAI